MIYSYHVLYCSSREGGHIEYFWCVLAYPEIPWILSNVKHHIRQSPVLF